MKINKYLEIIYGNQRRKFIKSKMKRIKIPILLKLEKEYLYKKLKYFF